MLGCTMNRDEGGRSCKNEIQNEMRSLSRLHMYSGKKSKWRYSGNMVLIYANDAYRKHKIQS